VGEQSPGRCLIVEILPLDNGDILVYPHGQSQTANGAVLEGNGVTPDVIVSLDRESLLKGEDIQLNTALQVLSEQIKTQP
jgi:C-terminal processing protease CtpA/Prc